MAQHNEYDWQWDALPAMVAGAAVLNDLLLAFGAWISTQSRRLPALSDS